MSDSRLRHSAAGPKRLLTGLIDSDKALPPADLHPSLEAIIDE